MPSGDASITIRELFKIFGSSAALYVEAVRNGLSKAELVRRHRHVLALKNISIAMPADVPTLRRSSVVPRRTDDK